MLTLAEAAAQPPNMQYRRKQECGVAAWIATLPPAEQEAAATLLADPARIHSHIHKLFRDNGLLMEYEATRKHRKGDCACRR